MIKRKLFDFLKFQNKKGIAMETLGYMLIALAVLAIMIFGYIVLNSKGIGALEYIKNLFRFGR